MTPTPEQEARQRIDAAPGGTLCLVRLFVDVFPGLETAVTVYRTSKIEKYWRTP